MASIYCIPCNGSSKWLTDWLSRPISYKDTTNTGQLSYNGSASLPRATGILNTLDSPTGSETLRDCLGKLIRSQTCTRMMPGRGLTRVTPWRRLCSLISGHGGRVTTSAHFIPTRRLPESRQATVHSHKVVPARTQASEYLHNYDAYTHTHTHTQLMLRAGLIRQTSSGVYHLLPLGLRALDKLISLVDREMAAIGGAKLALSMLTPAAQWKTSGPKS